MTEGLGKRIRKGRLSKGWSQADLAQRAGVSQSVISHLERGNYKNPRVHTLWKIASVLGISLADLFRE